MSLPERLLPRVENFVYYPDREKVSGRMYSGSADALLEGYTFRLHLWHHGRDNETQESLLPKLSIRAIELNDPPRYYDANWHLLWNDAEAWLTSIGWFGENSLKKALIGQFGEWFPNVNRSQTFDSKDFTSLGFTRLW